MDKNPDERYHTIDLTYSPLISLIGLLRSMP